MAGDALQRFLHGCRREQHPHRSSSPSTPEVRSRPALHSLAVLILSCACASFAPASAASNATRGDVADPAITITPSGDTCIGPQDDFDPATLHLAYVLSNRTTAPLVWGVRISVPWLSLEGPANGILAPGESVELPVEVDPVGASADALEPAVGELLFLRTDRSAILGARTVSVASSFAGQSRFGGNSSFATSSGGWTIFTPSSDTRMVYVSSSSGNDQNDGLSSATPKSTLAAAKALMRDSFPDWLLLERGDVWHESLGQWKASGRSPSEPMLVSTYGGATERPLLETGKLGGVWTNGSIGSPATIDNLALVGVHFRADGYAGGGDCVGAQMLQPGSHFLIEDCEFEGYSSNLVFQGYGGHHTDFRLRRSVIVDAYAIHSIGGHSQGLYVYAVDGLLIEENLFDHNGWNEHVPGAGADMFSHDLYIDNGNSAVIVRGNIIANASSHGMQLRCGGSAVNNLFVRDSIALNVGGGNNPEAGGVQADVRGNVILDGKDIDAANPRGWALWLANIQSGHVAYNVVANNSLGTLPNAVTIDGAYAGDYGPTLGVHNLTIDKNVFYDWGGSLLAEGDSSQITQLTFAGNDEQNTSWPTSLLECPVGSSTAAFQSSSNRFFCQLVPTSDWTEINSVPHPIDYWLSLVGDSTSVVQQVSYPDPTRSPASYNATLGGAFGLDAFLAEARKQSFTYWRPAYMAAQVNRYIRRGF